LNVFETDNAQNLELAREVARHFRLKPARADAVIGEVVQAARGWRAAATQVGLARTEQDRMADAFRLCS